MRSKPGALRIGIAALALAACSLVASGAAGSAPFAHAKKKPAKKAALPPKGWTGTVKYHYTVDFPDQEETDVTETATVTLRQVPNRPRGFYVSKSGTIAWTAGSQEASTGCKYSTSGSRAVDKYDAFFDIEGRPAKAAWSAPDNVQFHVTYACPPPYTAYEADVTILHPFFLLTRKTAGVPVNKKLTLITGSSPGSQTSVSGKESWTYTWSFRATR